MTEYKVAKVFYNPDVKYIANTLSLRPPQLDSLNIFAEFCDLISFSKTPNLVEDLERVHSKYNTVTSFERDFPSICFNLATGIGKTRLMGACIAYLYYAKNVKNFFVMAPNLTIYDKLKRDLSNPSSPKYMFKGLDKFVDPPRVLTGDNYLDLCSPSLTHSDVVVNVFNISKLNTDSKDSKRGQARIKRLSEILGESYFDYLKNLPDLCIFMDESHHYHADKSFNVINDLHPLLGVELTATPQIQKKSKAVPFKNIIYEYTLAHALNDGKYVKVPTVFTRRDFKPEQYTEEQLDREKLLDGVRLHEKTKSDLDIYSRTYGKKLIKPFMLVVAKDTDHSKQILDYITSNDFFGGCYRHKVIEINSNQSGVEKDYNIQQLLKLEDDDNKIEIVIHVNMLKEGWDVSNLFTIVPLRASASATLTEQTIGRGLRLPYGERTGIEAVDRLSIVSHDKYQKIIDLANDPNSLVRKVRFVDDVEDEDNSGKERETVEMPSTFSQAISSDDNKQKYEELLSSTFSPIQTEASEIDSASLGEAKSAIIDFVTDSVSNATIGLSNKVESFNDLKNQSVQSELVGTVVEATINRFEQLQIEEEVIKELVETIVVDTIQLLTDKVIPIPRVVVQPHTEVECGFYDFDLDTSAMKWHPSKDTLLGQELREDGNQVIFESELRAETATETPENEIIKRLMQFDNINYFQCKDLLYKLVNSAKEHFLSYLNEDAARRVMQERQKTLAEMIHSQMNEHFYKEKVDFQAESIRPFTKIETCYGGKFKADEIFDLIKSSDYAVKTKVYSGFKKACHTLYKFDSSPEKVFAVVLETDPKVEKWLRPAPKQFNIYWGPGEEHRYEPDFVVETSEKIYMIEVKRHDQIEKHDEEVFKKAEAGIEYCRTVSEWNKTHNGKPWEYALLPDNEIKRTSSFDFLIANRAKC